jgi:hypothetical protein
MSDAHVTAHLKKFAPNQRKLLSDLRDHITSKLPSAEQVIKYGIPTFLIEGVPVIGFARLAYSCDPVLLKTGSKSELGLPMMQRARSTRKPYLVKVRDYCASNR